MFGRQRDPKYNLAPVNFSWVPGAAAWCLIIVTNTFATLPVFTNILLQGSQRGIAVSLDGDAPFEATFERNSQSVIITVSGVIYGLENHQFNRFDRDFPIESIDVKEGASSKPTVITIKMRIAPNAQVPGRRRDNRWVAILTSSPVPDFQWSAATQVNNSNSMASPQTVQHTDNRQSSLSDLRDISIFQRGELCGLRFNFDAPVQANVRKDGDSILILFEMASAGSVQSVQKLPETLPFTALHIQERIRSGKTLLGVTVRLNSSLLAASQVVTVDQGKNQLVYVQQKTSSVSLWNTTQGMVSSYEFVEDHESGVDLASLGERVRKAAETQLAPGAVFSLTDENGKETSSVAPVASEEKTTVSEPPPATVDQIELDLEPLIVIADKVNFRSHPSTGGDSQVLATLNKGDKLVLIEKTNHWVHVRAGDLQGWVSTRLVQDSSMVDPQLWAAAAPQQEPILQDYQEEIPESNTQPVAQSTEPGSMVQTALLTGSGGIEPKPVSNAVIRYHSYGIDPFIPLSRDSLSRSGLPKVENLRLVGLLYDSSDKLALCEDFRNQKKAYSLREDDLIENGRVLRIYQDRVVFLISELGISRSVTLHLSKNTATEVRGQ